LWRSLPALEEEETEEGWEEVDEEGAGAGVVFRQTR